MPDTPDDFATRGLAALRACVEMIEGWRHEGSVGLTAAQFDAIYEARALLPPPPKPISQDAAREMLAVLKAEDAWLASMSSRGPDEVTGISDEMRGRWRAIRAAVAAAEDAP